MDRDAFDGLTRGTWILATLRVATNHGLWDALAEPSDAAAIAERTKLPLPILRSVLDVLRTLDLAAREGNVWCGTPALAALREGGLGELSVLATELPAAFAGGNNSWPFESTIAIRAQGDLSERMGRRMLRMHFARLPGFEERLQKGGRTFDIGAGTCGSAVAMAQAYPHSHVVAFEPAPEARIEGQLRIDRAGVGDRVELRATRIEEIDEHDVYDGGYVAQMFMPDSALVEGLPRVVRAMRSGGWLTTGAVVDESDSTAGAISRLRNRLRGGGERTADAVMTAFREAGLVDVEAVSGVPGMIPIAGRKP